MLTAPVLAADPASVLLTPQKQPLALDVKLDAKRGLHGELRDAQGKLMPKTDVTLWQQKQLKQRTLSDAQGRFRFTEVRGGIYQIATPEAAITCRAWTAQAAPPHARESLLIVTNIYSARGQQPINEVFCYNPFLMGTIIAAAIAIPIAIHDSGDGNFESGTVEGEPLEPGS